jgi:CheY-like chemotaxis protein
MENFEDIVDWPRARSDDNDPHVWHAEEVSSAVQRLVGFRTAIPSRNEQNRGLICETVATVENSIQRTVLLVDDEAWVRAYVKTVLQREGIQVLEAVDGADALALLQKLGGAVDVLLTDVRMPRMTGTELVKAIKTDFPNIPVVYISGEPLKQELHDPLHGVVFLQKPFVPRTVIETVRGIILEPASARGSSG